MPPILPDPYYPAPGRTWLGSDHIAMIQTTHNAPAGNSFAPLPAGPLPVE